MQTEMVQSHILCDGTYCKSSIKPPPFQGRKVNKPPLPSIHYSSQKLAWTDQLWLIQAGNSYFFCSSAA